VAIFRLFLCFLVRLVALAVFAEFFQFNFAFHLLAVFGRPVIGVLALGAIEFL